MKGRFRDIDQSQTMVVFLLVSMLNLHSALPCDLLAVHQSMIWSLGGFCSETDHRASAHPCRTPQAMPRDSHAGSCGQEHCPCFLSTRTGAPSDPSGFLIC